MSTVHLKRRQVLELYDTVQKDGGFATALSALAGEEMAVALLEHCLVQQGRKVTRIPGVPTTGRSRGPRLDGWLEIDGQLAQIEVKNWGANAIGGKEWSGKPDVGWGQFLAWFKNRKLQKVLYPMKPPTGYNGRNVDLAIACMWPVMHVDGGADSFFPVPVTKLPRFDFSPLPAPDPPFEQLHVFSMSAYLHTLNDDTVNLIMPRTYARLEKLETILGIRGEVFSAA